ncbi:hypothetical protein UFOVP163_43 [uncultured Caudovirales phage]|uniref:Uncharacterized protein n=1 Tax=uncultured Caudovirales phage TaxID=2100421 RepID=A0A6J7WFJ7_9CAUD|nr:hypothetical protein UFOVP163_43 [uncultured Caudovirales phage]
MARKDGFIRLVQKRMPQGSTPSVPLSDDHTDGTWTYKDLYDGEIAINDTGAFYYRSLDTIYQLGTGTGSGTNGATGATGATGADGYRAVMNLSYTGSSLTLGLGALTLPIGTPINNLGWQEGTRIRVWHSATQYMEGQVSAPISNPQTSGIHLIIDYVVGSGTFGSWYCGIAGDLGSGSGGGIPYTGSMDYMTYFDTDNSLSYTDTYYNSGRTTFGHYTGTPWIWDHAGKLNVYSPYSLQPAIIAEGGQFGGMFIASDNTAGGQLIGLQGYAGGSQVSGNLGIYGRADGTQSSNIGGEFVAYNGVIYPGYGGASNTGIVVGVSSYDVDPSIAGLTNSGIQVTVSGRAGDNNYIGQFQDGSEGAGKVLTCIDGTGLATWQTPTGGGGATPSLSQVLTVGNTTGARNIIFNNSYGLKNSSGEGAVLLDQYEINATHKKYLNATDWKSGLFQGSGHNAVASITGDYWNQTADLYSAGSVDVQNLYAKMFYQESTISTGNGYQTAITIYRDSILVNSAYNSSVINSNFQGFTYNHDYSANFTPRSLVDKAYVDNAITAGGGGGGTVSQIVTQVRNQSGATMYKGMVVYISGSTGTLPLVTLSQANSEATSARTYGIIKNDIANNGTGYVVSIGSIQNLDTRSTATNPFTSDTLADGDRLYLSPTTAGYVTKTKPSAPNHLVYIGTVIRTSPTAGYIEYQIQNGYELEELHNVSIPTTPTDGQVLTYETSTSLWKAKTPAVTSASPLSSVLLSGNTASTSIDMNGYNITEIGSLGTPTLETVEMVNVLNMTLLTLMYNT